ncbi:F-box/kelch-repeat protein At3g23880-like [Silene latifolia]|uniref:F-box/kelch-repeat protein At3g23880-like n=1 Tax=Silene latifolia TaxID=37657 RepID=UPI003D780841
MKSRTNSTTSSSLQQNSETLSNIRQYLFNIPESKYLPPEVWTQILSSLPAKTLLQFRCVCKSWYSIIDNPDFIHLHFQHCKINSGNNKLLLALESFGEGNKDKRRLFTIHEAETWEGNQEGWVLTVREAETLENTSVIFRKPDSYSYHIKSSCNGLLLVGRYGPRFHDELKLWNPCIRKSLLLPTCPLSLPRATRYYLLGFAPHSKDYKVVAFACESSQDTDIQPRKMHSAVYTLRDQLWTVKNPITTCIVLDLYSLSTAVFFRGATYWLLRNHNQSTELSHLGSFDFDKEIINLLELPFSLDETGFVRFLFLLGGSLAVFSISQVTSSIWVLEQDNEKRPWTRWFSGKSTWDAHQLFLGEKCSYQKVFYYESDGGYFVCGNMAYNIASGQVHPLKRYMSSHLKLETYSESLVLSKGYEAPDSRDFP